MVDIAAAKGVEMLGDAYRITQIDIEQALKRQKTALREGDVVLLRTDRMRNYEN